MQWGIADWGTITSKGGHEKGSKRKVDLVSVSYLEVMQQKITSLSFTVSALNIAIGIYFLSFMPLLPPSRSFLFLCKPNLLFSLEIQRWWLVCFHCQVLLSVSLLLSFTCTLKQRHYVNREQMTSYNKASKALLCVIMNCLLSPHIVDQLWNLVLFAINWNWGDSTFFESLWGLFQGSILIPTSFCQGPRLVWWPYIDIPVAGQEEGHRFWSPGVADIWCHLKRLSSYKVWHLPGLYLLLSFLCSFLAVLQYYVHFQR